ncbi:MAG TPA: aminotransferase class IV, partial [Candidatus Dormibacteraeota bacterium]|nr:aminotransferase class IV [Candidatus Dormibacteraeota bacterium]
EPVDPDDPLRYHKTSLRATYEAAARRHPNADDVLLLNPEGHLVESTVANVAVRLDGRWWTPPLEAGCLPGVLRAQLLADGRLTERSISTTDLDGADGLALLNSVRGWRPAALADRSAGGPGPPAP